MLKAYLVGLDKNLKKLAQSDSGIEYAPHMRENFDLVIESVNAIKECLDENTKKSDEYFE